MPTNPKEDSDKLWECAQCPYVTWQPMSATDVTHTPHPVGLHKTVHRMRRVPSGSPPADKPERTTVAAHLL